MKLSKKPRPDLWVSKVPFGLGKIKPHHIRDTMKVIWENKDSLPYATKILTQGVCDGCALGVSGLKDQTLKGPHLCTTRLNVLRLNTMPAMTDDVIFQDIDELRKLSSTELRKLGRIPYPLIRRRGERKFTRISWDEALDTIAEKIKTIDPKQLAFYLTSRGITNETYYVAGKVARFLGTNNIDNASRICHSPSKTALNVRLVLVHRHVIIKIGLVLTSYCSGDQLLRTTNQFQRNICMLQKEKVRKSLLLIHIMNLQWKNIGSHPSPNPLYSEQNSQTMFTK